MSASLPADKHIGRTGQLWQHESYDHIVRSEAALKAFRRYIRANPTHVGGASTSLLSGSAREQDAPATVGHRPES